MGCANSRSTVAPVAPGAVCTLKAVEHTQESVRVPDGAFLSSASFIDKARAKGLEVTSKVRELQATNKAATTAYSETL